MTARRSQPRQGLILRRLRRTVVSGAGVLSLALAGACTMSTGGGASVEPDTRTAAEYSAAAEESQADIVVARGGGGAEVRYSPDVFPAGVTPDVRQERVDADDFASVFALPTRQGQAEGESVGDVDEVDVVRVTAAAQPDGDVEVVVPYDPSTVPPGTVPAIFYHDDELDLWLPIMTEPDAGAGVLVGTTDHFTDFVAGVLEVVDSGVRGAARGVDWVQYQLAATTGARADEPDCNGEVPSWVAGVDIHEDPDFPLNIPLYVCAGSSYAAGSTEDGPGLLEVKVALNRGYSLEMTSTVPPTAYNVTPEVEFGQAAYTSLARMLSGAGDDVHYLLPATGEAVFRYGATDQPGTITIQGTVSGRSALLDLITVPAGIALSLAELTEAQAAATIDCYTGVVENAVDQGTDLDPERLVGQLGEVAAGCLETAYRSNGGSVPDKAKRILKGLEVGLLLGRGGQSAIDGIRAVGVEGEYRVVITTEAGGELPGAQAAAALGNISGVWRGRAAGDQDYYDVELDISPYRAAAGGYSVAIRYPDYRDTGEVLCGGTLEPAGVTQGGDVLLFVERIEYEVANTCTRDGDVRLWRVDDRTLYWEYVTPDGETSIYSYLSPDGVAPATALHQVPSDGVGDSGEPVSAPVGGAVPAQATVQWVGCDQAPAVTVYDLGGRSSELSGIFSLQDGAPDGLSATFAVTTVPGDGSPGDVLVSEVVLGDGREPFRVAVTGLDQVAVTAIAGEDVRCTVEPTGYGALLQAMVRP